MPGLYRFDVSVAVHGPEVSKAEFAASVMLSCKHKDMVMIRLMGLDGEGVVCPQHRSRSLKFVFK